MKRFFDKVLALLRVRSVVAGLEVSDEVIRLAYFDKKIWRLNAMRLAPGTVMGGVVKDRAAFVAAVTELKTISGIAKHDAKKKVNVVVSISSTTPYSKVFRLPDIKGGEFAKAVELNLQMSSPGAAADFYSGWQVVGHDTNEGQADILSAFVERSPVDTVVDALFSAGFVAMAVESRALAVARVFRAKGSGIDTAKSYVLMTVDNVGMEFLVIRSGQLYFEYAHRWNELENARGEIDPVAFDAQLATSLRQVLNFYAEQWKEPIAAIVLAAVGLNAEIEKTIAQSVTLPAIRLTLVMGQPISSEWLVALGCSLRGGEEAAGGQQVSFLGAELEQRYHIEEMLRFLEFWQAVVPLSLALLVATFVAGSVFLAHAKTTLEVGGGYVLPPGENVQLNTLMASSTVFNGEVAMIAAIQGDTTANDAAILGDVRAIAAASEVTISTLTDDGLGNISLSGSASSADRISAFQAAAKANSHISVVNLPLTTVVSQGANYYTFSMTFEYK